jgi:hypothetical protein
MHPRLRPLLCLAACASIPAAAAEPPLSWFKGNTHTHSLWSDGDDFPEMIARGYRERGYHFLVLSDHNILSRSERWMKVSAVESRRRGAGSSTLARYEETFGTDWVVRRGEGAEAEVRLRTLEEIRPKLEVPGAFALIEGEEITGAHGENQIHINAVNVAELIKPQRGPNVRDTIRANLAAVREQAERLQRPILAHLNHPNYRWSITAEDLAHVLELKYFEVYNGHPDVNQLGDATRPSIEKIWDVANTLRLALLGGFPLYGIGCDDSHHYHGGSSRPFRGWVMVQAASLRAEDLLPAMDAGRFYASSGVTFRSVGFDPATGELSLDIAPDGDAVFTTRIVGTRKGAEKEPDRIGETLATYTGTLVQHRLAGDEWYARAVVTSSRAHPDPSFEGQLQQAWTQPVRPTPR